MAAAKKRKVAYYELR